MSKRVAFLPSLHTKGFLEDGQTCLDKGTEYVPQREKDKLMFPDRVNDHKNTFKLCSTGALGFFTKPVGQEFDKIDEEMKRYMKSNERGILKPFKDKNGESIRREQEKTFMPGTKGVWQPNTFTMSQLDKTTPLNFERQMTPRAT